MGPAVGATARLRHHAGDAVSRWKALRGRRQAPRYAGVGEGAGGNRGGPAQTHIATEAAVSALPQAPDMAMPREGRRRDASQREVRSRILFPCCKDNGGLRRSCRSFALPRPYRITMANRRPLPVERRTGSAPEPRRISLPWLCVPLSSRQRGAGSGDCRPGRPVERPGARPHPPARFQ